MPYNKRKQKCTQSDGDKGNYVLSYTTKKGEKRRACHTSKKKMQGQIAAIEMESDEKGSPIEESGVVRITKNELRRIISKALIKENAAFVASGDGSPMNSRVDPEFAAAIKGNPLNVLSDYLGSLRATQLWFHAAHNLTKGTGFSGDHVNLYGEIYLQLQEDFDVAVEKAIGLTQDEGIGCPIKITGNALEILKSVPSPSNMAAIDIAVTALALIQNHIRILTEIFTSLESSGSLPLGLNDFLAASANSYDTFVYLLAQRIKE